MLGGTREFLGDAGGDERGKRTEKLKIVKRGGAALRNLEDKASVKYNYADFLSQAHNLTDQCKHLVEALSQATQECIICSNPIYQRSAVWNCRQCCQPFHLGCMKRWIHKLNTGKEGIPEEMEGDEEEEKVHDDGRARPGDEDDDFYEDEGQEVHGKKDIRAGMFAFYSWTCPNCNYSHAEGALPRYKCFCGRFEEPAYSPLVLPHSCGEYCERKKHETCSHGRCELLCHPGSCPPCSIQVAVQCHCGQEEQRVPCQLAARTKFACENKCGKLLNCLIHECERDCHEGPCDPCKVQVTSPCFCGQEERQAACGSKRQACGRVCNRTLDCSKH